MAAQHTPGPWNYRPLAGARSQWVILAGDRYPLATVGTVEADARLIAAAPELLASLESVLESIADLELISAKEHEARVMTAYRAIAKAEGRD
jgi:hypothetical protein